MAGSDLSQLTEEQIRNLPLEDLEALVMQRTSELAAMTENDPELEGIMSPANASSGPEPVNPDAVMAATAVLVQAGLLQTPTAEVTPEVIAALQSFVDKLRPGLYDLSIPQDLSEVIDGIANGTIGLELPAPTGPDAAAAGIPAGPDAGAGGPTGVPAGLPAGPVG